MWEQEKCRGRVKPLMVSRRRGGNRGNRGNKRSRGSRGNRKKRKVNTK